MSEQTALFEEDDEFLLKHVNAVALMPSMGGRRISLLGRRLFNVLLHRAQEDGVRDEYEATLQDVLEGARYNSNDTGAVRKVLKELMTTTVEWQSPSDGDIETWDACNLLSGAGTTKDKRTGAVTVRWRYDVKVRAQLLSPDRWARLSLEASTQLSSHASMALYEICARYVNNPGHKTARQHWRWWRPVLIGVARDDSKAEYRFFKRDVLHKAIAEINARTNLIVRGPIEYKGSDNKTVTDIQFEVFLKDGGAEREPPRPMAALTPADLPVVGRAVAAGVPQPDVETLVKKFGGAKVAVAVGALEKRQQMPSEKVGAVNRPGGWLKANLTRGASVSRDVAGEGAPPLQQISPEDLAKHRAAWNDEWLRRRRTELADEFDSYTEDQQQIEIRAFAAELESKREVQTLKRLETSGWRHRMVIQRFMKFFGSKLVGPEWDRPTAEDILAIAAELATRNAR